MTKAHKITWTKIKITENSIIAYNSMDTEIAVIHKKLIFPMREYMF